MKALIFSFLLAIIFTGFIKAQNANDWRPENRTGVSAETGLLKSWPATGPTLIWSNLNLAKGFSSPSFGNSTIYITGNKDADDVLFALDMNGKILWQTVIGRAWKQSNPESRATPV